MNPVKMIANINTLHIPLKYNFKFKDHGKMRFDRTTGGFCRYIDTLYDKNHTIDLDVTAGVSEEIVGAFKIEIIQYNFKVSFKGKIKVFYSINNESEYEIIPDEIIEIKHNMMLCFKVEDSNDAVMILKFE